MCLVARKVGGSEMPFHRTGYDTQAQHTWCALQQQIHSLKERKTKGTERKGKTETGKKKKRRIITIRYYFHFAFSVDRVSHNDEAKLNRMRRRDPLPVASKGMGRGG